MNTFKAYTMIIPRKQMKTLSKFKDIEEESDIQELYDVVILDSRVFTGKPTISVISDYVHLMKVNGILSTYPMFKQHIAYGKTTIFKADTLTGLNGVTCNIIIVTLEVT